jgi:hypothetical protein
MEIVAVKRGFIVGIILLVFISIGPAFGQSRNQTTSNREHENYLMFQLLSPEERAKLREQWPDMSEKERREFRDNLQKKWNNLAEEDKQKLIAQSQRGFSDGPGSTISRENQLSAIKVVETQLAKLKSIVLEEPEGGRPTGEMSGEERSSLREQQIKTSRERERAIQTIITQINILQSQRPLRPNTNNERYVILSVDDLKQVQKLAAKEKADETVLSIGRLIAKSTNTGTVSGGRSVPRPQSGIARPPRPGRGPSGNREGPNR